MRGTAYTIMTALPLLSEYLLITFLFLDQPFNVAKCLGKV